MNLMQRILWAIAGTIALVSLQLSSRPSAPKAATSLIMSRFQTTLQNLGIQSLGAIETAEARSVRYVPPSWRVPRPNSRGWIPWVWSRVYTGDLASSDRPYRTDHSSPPKTLLVQG